MDLKKIFNEDIAFNAANPRYGSETSDDEYGERRNGFGVKNTEENNLRFTFDNGHLFELTPPDRTLFYQDAGLAYFIDKYIEIALNTFIAENKVGAPISRYQDEMESLPFIRVVVHRREHIVAISNIHLSPCMQHQGLGKKAISIIYDICKRLNYKLYFSANG